MSLSPPSYSSDRSSPPFVLSVLSAVRPLCPPTYVSSLSFWVPLHRLLPLTPRCSSYVLLYRLLFLPATRALHPLRVVPLSPVPSRCTPSYTLPPTPVPSHYTPSTPTTRPPTLSSFHTISCSFPSRILLHYAPLISSYYSTTLCCYSTTLQASTLTLLNGFYSCKPLACLYSVASTPSTPQTASPPYTPLGYFYSILGCFY